jgi:hypothetical protein
MDKNRIELLTALLIMVLTIPLPAQCERRQVVEDYLRYFEGTQVRTSDLAWSGDASTCKAGDISIAARQMTLERINYFRRLAKLPTAIGFDTSLTSMCQRAALIMHRNNRLSHEPEENWFCYSNEGKTAAGKSNLALGAHSSEAIALYMEDPGINNHAVGHRRWILYSLAKDFGMGSTDRAHVLFVINNKITTPKDVPYIAYPSSGYFPAPLLPDRWSLSVPGAQFDQADVRMTDEQGMNIITELQPLKNGFGDNTLVWELSGQVIDKYLDYDQTYFVRVTGIRKGQETLKLEYSVTVAPVIHPPTCLDGLQWNDAECQCLPEQVTAVVDRQVNTFWFSPNPADEFTELNLSGMGKDEPGTINIFDLSGRLALKKDLQGERSLVTKNLPSGLYYTRIHKPSGTIAGKLLIRH